MWIIIKQALGVSWQGLLANKARSFLTMLGIVIGVGSVIMIMSFGLGVQSLILGQIQGLGSNLISVTPGKSENNGPPASVMGVTITSLTYEDLQLLRRIPGILGASGYSNSVGTVSRNNNAYDTNIRGTTEDYLIVEGGEVESGRFFTADEENNLAKVVILGSVVKTEVFGDSDAVGQRVRINNQMYEVIGVMKVRGKVAFQDYDDQVIIPLKTVQKLMLGVDYLNYARVKVQNESDLTYLVSEIEAILRERHDIKDATGVADDFSVRSLEQAISLLTTVTDAMRFFLVAMAAIALIVGGIGIMNIMLAGVSKRTREIGLRKAVGAKNQDIVFQFLAESVFLTLIGGIIGIIFGIFVSFIAAVIVRQLGYDYNLIIPISSVFLGIGVSMLIGIIFGLYPARKASSLEPVEALSYE